MRSQEGGSMPHSNEFWDFQEAKWPGIKLQKGPQYKHLSWDIIQDLSWDIIQDPDTGIIRRSQSFYIKDVLKSLKVDKFLSFYVLSVVKIGEPCVEHKHGIA